MESYEETMVNLVREGNSFYQGYHSLSVILIKSPV